MAFKNINDLSTDTTISLGGFNKKLRKDNPTSIEGYFLGSRQIPDTKKKSGISYIHVFQTANGNVGVWGKTDMDRKLTSATPGVMTRVSFDKMVATTNGEMYKYIVAVDEENTIEVSGAGNGANAGAGADEDYDYAAGSGGGGGYEAEEEQGEDDEDALQAQALAAAEKRAKVEALLKGNKGKSVKG